MSTKNKLPAFQRKDGNFSQRAVVSASNTTDITQSELSKYLIDIRNSADAVDPLNFWTERYSVYPRLALLAQDLISAPASQAFVERIFQFTSYCRAQKSYRKIFSDKGISEAKCNFNCNGE